MSFSQSLSMALSFPIQSVNQIELAGYDASRILISSNLHLNNGRSWEAISLFFFLSFPLLEPPIPLSCPPFCLCFSANSPHPSFLYCVFGKMGKKENKGWRGSPLDCRLSWMFLDIICGLGGRGQSPPDNELYMQYLSLHTHTNWDIKAFEDTAILLWCQLSVNDVVHIQHNSAQYHQLT